MFRTRFGVQTAVDMSGFSDLNLIPRCKVWRIFGSRDHKTRLSKEGIVPKGACSYMVPKSICNAIVHTK